MKQQTPYKAMKQILVLEAVAFSVLIAVVWLNERFHFPSKILGADYKGFEWEEAALETIVIIGSAALVMTMTRRVMKHIQQLEGILPICSNCKDIRDEKGHWHQIETYVHKRSDADFSHSLCPHCAKELYPEIDIGMDTVTLSHLKPETNSAV